MANIEKCKLCGFVAFHVQMRGHFTMKHPDNDYDSNIETIGSSDNEFKRYGFRPSIDYYRAKLEGKNVSPFQYKYWWSQGKRLCYGSKEGKSR